MSKPLLEVLATDISKLDNKDLWHYLEQAREMKAQGEAIEKLIKSRCVELMGDADSIALEGDAGVYIQYSPRYEVSYNDAQNVVKDVTMLYDITKIDMTKAKEILPGDLFLELKIKQTLKGDPIKKLMVGKIKHYEA